MKRSTSDAGLDLLARRDHFAAELRLKLRQKDFPIDEIEDFIQKAMEHGWINDRTSTQKYLAEQIRKGGHGRLWVQAKLMQKGIDASLLEELLSQEWDDQVEKDLALQQLAREQLSFSSSGIHEQKKVWDKLLRRGFNRSIVFDIMNR